MYRESCDKGCHWWELHCSFTKSPTDSTADEVTPAEEYFKEWPDRPPRCCPHWAQGTNSDGCIDLPNETESTRYPYFARGYPKGRKLLSISSPVKAGDTLSPSHPPKLLRVRASFIWTLWKFWSPGITERECLPTIHHPEARCGTLWMMWQVHSLGKTRLRSGFPWTTQLKLLCRGHTKL